MYSSTLKYIYVIVFSFSVVNDTKMIPNLISPLVDDRHVDIIYANGHFPPSWGSISGPHPFVHIALDCPLKKNESGSKEARMVTKMMTKKPRKEKERTDLLCSTLT